ncbi:type 2 periplasmic-binding domain-containing protein [Cupriavidus pinatubonensis]|uniref:LysR substrate-binding domain-containing protein n=1 Tax=Cupriavidus pinatubonensis TaxID=248026 RepID=A0ABN7ZT64_9BURK|nr:hypothetical protein LMG23994_06557 [Cupriavidus pinatubonensis]
MPQELANVFSRYGIVRVVKPPVALPPYALSQYWHPRFHHDPAIVWLRQLVKQTFDRYPDTDVSGDAMPVPARKKGATAKRGASSR